MNKIFLLLCWLGASHLTHAQTLTVLDSQTGIPIDMATLASLSPKAFAMTNALGQADIGAFQGAAAVEIRMLGYETVVASYAELAKMDFQLSLHTTATAFDAVVVSATRWRQAAGRVPSRVAVISARDVALLNPQTAADLLGASGEVFIQKSQQGGGSPMIRGFATNRLLYAVDGVRMNSAIFRAGNIQNVISLDAFAVEQTEVLFGPGSVLYGSDAIGGVMSFTTLSPQLSATDKPLVTGQAVARHATANAESTQHFHVGVGGRKWASVTSLTHTRFGDLRMGAHGPDEYLKTFTVQRADGIDQVLDNPTPQVQTPSGYAQTNLMQKIRFSPSAAWDIQYSGHLSETTEFARYDRLIETQPNGLPSSAVWNYGPQVWRMHLLSATHHSPTRLYDRMTVRLAQQYFEESRIDRRFGHHRLRTQREQVRAYSANADFEKRMGQHHVYYGLEYVMNDVVSTGSAVDIRDGSHIDVPDRYPASQWGSYAGYANYQWEASARWLVQAGVRVGAFRIQSDFAQNLAFFPFDFSQANVNNAATTGSLGAVFRPDATWKISLNASTGFRAPNVDDIGKIFDFGAGEVIVPNPALAAEYAYNAELGVVKTWGEVVRLDATVFYTYLDNAMVRRTFQVAGQDSILYDGVPSQVFAIQNAAFGTVYGLQVGVEAKLPAGFGLSSRYNYQRGREEMDSGTISPSRHAAPAFGVTRLTFTHDQLQLQTYAMYSAQVRHADLNVEEQGKPAIYANDANGNPYSPSWMTLNVKGLYQFHEHLSVSAGVENITDRRYRPYSSGLAAPGRNVVLALRADF